VGASSRGGCRSTLSSASLAVRKFISILNLVAAVGMTILMTVGLLSLTIQSASQFVACLLWIFCAVWLRRSRRLWPWIGCLVLVSAMALAWGAELLRVMSLIWRAEYGDRTVEIDPSTVGAPLFLSGLFTVATLALLAALFSFPARPSRKEADV
jgi:hypothetical protein